MSSPPVRRSARAPKPNPRFEDKVPWNDDTLRLLRYDSNSSDRSSTSEDSRTQADQDVEMEDVAEVEESEEEAFPGQRTRSVTNDVQTPSLPISDDETPMLPTKHRSAKISFRLSRKEIYPQIFGPNIEDLYPILQSRDIWHLYPRDVVFPSRASLKVAIQLHTKGEYLEQKQEEEEEEEPKVNENYQNSQEITRHQAIAERYLEPGKPHDIVLGPRDEPQKFTLPYHEPFQVAQAWLRSSTNVVLAGPEDIDIACQKGWILNLGARPQCLAWAPSSTDVQFLAVSFRCSKSQRDIASPPQTKVAPAFAPSPAYPSRIEIWRIKARPGNAGEPAQLDHHVSPKLVQVVCLKYGNILKMEWFPRRDDEHSLCILTTDGNIRVLNLKLLDGEQPSYLQIDHPQLIANAPANTIFTSFALPSPNDLIGTDASGAIHLFSLTSTTPTLTPYATLQIHNTYIMSISCIHSHPQFICTSSAGGEYILTDLRSPHVDRAHIQTARLPTRNLCYLPFTRTFLTTLDSSGRFESTSFTGSTVISHNLRDFKTSKPVLRLPDSGGIATCLAGSAFHPIIAVGNAGGSVFVSNHVRRCLPIANAKEGVGGWMVRLCGYEWKGFTEKEKQDRRGTNEAGNSDVTSSTSGLQQEDYSSQKPLSPVPPSASNPIAAVDPSNTYVSTSKQPQNAANDTTTSDAAMDTSITQPGSHEEEVEEIDIYHGPSHPKSGISRITEGFKPYKISVSKLENARTKGTAKKVNGTKGKGRPKGKSKAKAKRKRSFDEEDEDMDDDDVEMEIDGHGRRRPKVQAQQSGKSVDDGGQGQGQVIYHEEQAVTCLAWNGSQGGNRNGNVRFSSWLAIAWGSGIVRICDLGHDLV